MRRTTKSYGLALLLAVPASGVGRSVLAGRRGAGARGALGRATGPDRPAPAGRNAARHRSADPPASRATARPKEKTLAFPVGGGALRSGPAGGRNRDAPPIPTRARPAEAGGVARTLLASARQHGLDPLLVKAVILAESAGRPRARSPKGAMGLMQLMPATARRFGVADPYDPAQNVAGGTRYLRWLLDRFGGNVTLALAGYNAGEGAVDRHGGIPPYRETRNYVRIVQSNHRLLRQRVAERLAGRAQ